MTRLCLALLLLILPFTPARADEQKQVGTLVEAEGVVTRNHMILEKDAAIHLRDVIETEAGSRAVIVFIDDTEVTLGENASFSPEIYGYEPDAQKTEGAFSVLRGSFLFVSGLIAKSPEHDVKVKTSYGSIGIRGTTFWGGALDNKYGVLVLDGAVAVTNEGGETLVPAGEGTFMQGIRERPRAPKAWKEEKIGRAVKTITLRNPENAKARVNAQREKNIALRRKSGIRTERKIERSPATRRRFQRRPLND